jgi:hypothetical protein
MFQRLLKSFRCRICVWSLALTVASGVAVDHSVAAQAPVGQVDQIPWNSLRSPATHSHPILRAPGITGSGQRSVTAEDKSSHLVHPPYSPHRRRIQPPPPTLPGAKERAIWKTPYSYGYFGASGTRHWSLHHGYRERYTEWILQ